MWDHEADVVVVGYGGAGAATALTAIDEGADVLIVEKNPEGGGNTKYSGGSIRTYLDIDKGADYIESLCDGTTERDVIETFVRGTSKIPEWLVGMGAEVVPRVDLVGRYPGSARVAYPSTRGAEGVGPRVRVKGVTKGGGIDIWTLLSGQLAAKKHRVLYSSPLKQLLVEKDQGVTGIVVASGEKNIRIRARRGVVLTCGGFEHDRKMHLNYLGQSYYGLCNPANTGDGIRLAAEIGADLWHMNGVAGTMGYKFPEFDFAIYQSMSSAGFVYVDQFGKRYMDEVGTDSHLMWSPMSYIDTKTLQRTRVPSYVIFDEDTRMRGPIAETSIGKISDVYQWSSDNSTEITKGWIKAAQSLAELAPQINVLPDQLQMTVAQYNLQCVGGYDPDYGRRPDTLVPIARPPYYAVPIWPCLFNTQGGPKRNARAQILDIHGNPIKRLYSAGELGSLWHRNYPGAGNVSEAIAFGRIAGKTVVAERPAGS